MASDFVVKVAMDGSVPPGGVYANLVNVWHTGFEFTLEFAVSLPTGEDAIEAVSVARLKLPPRVAWELARMISGNVAHYEEEYGAFTPRPPDEEAAS